MVPDKNQLNYTHTNVNDNGTFSADSAHDGLSTTVSKGNDHDNKIFEHTFKSAKSIFDDRNSLFFGEPPPPELGNLPENNMCYVFDVHAGPSLKGVNQYLDSASTPRITLFIQSMIKKFHVNSLGKSPDYESVTKTKIGKPGLIYMFQLYNSLINEEIGTLNIAHRLDYSVYSNYDILLFMSALNNCAGVTIDSGFCSNLNTFLKKSHTDKKMNIKVKANLFIITNIIALNFLWQNLIVYCEKLMDPKGSNPREQESLNWLKSICFHNFAIDDDYQITFAKYKIGFVKTTPTNTNNLSFHSVDLSNDADVQQYIEYISYRIAQTYTTPLNRPADTSYTFITSQSLSASEIKVLLPNNSYISDRGEEKETKNEDETKDMKDGINALFGASINVNAKVYFYQLLKFQGDSSHLVMATLVKEAYKKYCIDQRFYLNKDTSGVYNYDFLPTTTPPVPMINITILTGEKPLTIRSVLEEHNVQSLNFVHLKIGSGTLPMIKHISDPCVFIGQRFKELSNLFTVDIKEVNDTNNIYKGLEDTLKITLTQCHNNIKENFTKLRDDLTKPINAVTCSFDNIPLHMTTPTTSIFPSTMHKYILTVHNNITKAKTSECSSLINSEYSDKIIFKYGGTPKTDGTRNENQKDITLNQFNDIGNSCKYIIEYFSKIEEFFKALTSFTREKVDRWHTNPGSSLVYNFIKQTYELFNKDGRLIDESKLNFEGRTKDILPDLIIIYTNIQKKIEELYGKLNDHLKLFHHRLSEHIYRITYNEGLGKYTIGEKNTVEGTYIIHKPWTPNNNYFIENFEFFMNKIQGEGGSKKGIDIEKREFSSLIGSIVSLFYLHKTTMSGDEQTKLESHYSNYDTIFHILKIIKFMESFKLNYEISHNDTPATPAAPATVKKGKTPPEPAIDIAFRKKKEADEAVINADTVLNAATIANTTSSTAATIAALAAATAALAAAKTAAVKAEEEFNELKYPDVSIDEVVKIAANMKEHLLFVSNAPSIGKYLKSEVLESRGNFENTKNNILFTLERDIINNGNPDGRTSTQDDLMITDLDNLAKRDNYTDSTKSKTFRFNKLKDPIKKLLTRLINIRGSQTKLLSHIVDCLNTLKQKDEYYDLNGINQEIGSKRIQYETKFHGGRFPNKTNKKKYKIGRTIKIYGGDGNIEIDNFNKDYLTYMDGLQKSNLPLNNVKNIMKHKYIVNKKKSINGYTLSYDLNTSDIDKKISKETFTRHVTRMYFNINNKIMNKDSSTFTLEERSTFIKDMTDKRSEFNEPLKSIVNGFLSYVVKTTEDPSRVPSALKLDDTVETLITRFKQYTDEEDIDYFNVLSLLVTNFYFYEKKEKKRSIMLDHLSYKTWIDIYADMPIGKLSAYLSDLHRFYSCIDYKEFMETKHDLDTYDETTFEQKYIFNILRGVQVDNEGNATYDKTISGNIINAYKDKVKSLIWNGLIREYTILDFVLYILKPQINDFQTKSKVPDKTGETIFDCYYALIQSFLSS
jgi:hypothetical protein